MKMKQLFRRTSQLLRAVLLLGAFTFANTTTKAQITNVTTGVIASQDDVATYNTILSNYPTDVSSMVPDIKTSWGGLEYNQGLEGSGQHWDGTTTSTYYDRWNGGSLNRDTHYKNTTITLSKGKYAVLTAARGGSNTDGASVTVYMNVMNNGTSYGEVSMACVGAVGRGISTSGDASFLDTDTYANEAGRGWRYFYIQFEVTADDTPVELRVSGASTGNSDWMSFCTPRLLSNLHPIIEKTFTIQNGLDYFTNPREYTVAFHFVENALDQWRINLINNSSNEVVASVTVDHGQGGGSEGYWVDLDKFRGDKLNPEYIPYFYVRWYLRDKSGKAKNISHSLINDIYQQTNTSLNGVVWSSRIDNETKLLHDILRMTVDGTPVGGNPFNLADYDLVCILSEAGNETVEDGVITADPSPISLEYIFHFNYEVLDRTRIDLTDKEVTHKFSYLYDYAKEFAALDLGKQGLSSDAQSDWWEYEKRTQRVNHFEITHFVKLNESKKYLLPTAQNTNDHTLYQRWYNYDNEEDVNSILSQVTLNGNGGSVPYYLYKNGLVTGDRIYWGQNRSYLNTGESPYAYVNFTYKNTDGKSLTVAADVSRYSDMTYQNPNSPLDGNLEEPSLTMRYIYYMKDAREMATNLTKKTFKGSNADNWMSSPYEATTEANTSNTDEANWMETKVFHFPSRQLAYENSKRTGYQGEFIGVRHIFSDYWIFDNQYDPENPGSYDDLNDRLISAIDNPNPNTIGNIVVKIYDPNNTGIRLGGCQKVTNSPWGNFVPQAGDIIRGYYTNGNGVNPIFKHGYTTRDWSDLQDSRSIIDYGNGNGYFETIIPANAVEELLTSGFTLQGQGFNLTSIDVIRNNQANTIFNQRTEFPTDNWNTILDISPVLYTIGGNGEYMGFYYHDLMHPWETIASYGDSRFLVFRYPDGGVVTNTNKEAYLRAYFVDPTNPSKRYQLAQYTLIFDEGAYGDGSATLPWKSVNGGQNVDENNDGNYDRMDYVQGTPRDPNQLRAKAGKPIAKITFDYPAGTTYHFPDKGVTNHGQNTHDGENYGIPRNQPYPDYSDSNNATLYPLFDWTIPDSSPIPLTFAKSNYAFDGENSLFGAYGLLTNMGTRWGNEKTCLPANHGTQNNGIIQNGSYGYAVAPDPGYQSGFLYIDASELPGDICSAPFVGDFCAGDHLMVSGWISGANNVNNGRNNQAGIRSPGGITLTLKGEHRVHGELKTETLYRFCPGMCYELDNGDGVDGYEDADHVVWQQFYFEFIVQEKFDRHWIEVNNNCVSSQGGDFMLDNIEVYTIVPDITPEINTPICVEKDGKVDMRLLKLKADFTKMKTTSETKYQDNTNVHYLGFVILEKDVFLKKLKEKVQALKNVPLEDLAENIAKGKILIEPDPDPDHPDDQPAPPEGCVYITKQNYKEAFDAALLRKEGDEYYMKMWKSDAAANDQTSKKGAGLLYFRWDTTFESIRQPVYSFTDAMAGTSAVYREVDAEGDRNLIFNGNYPELPWKASTEYYILPSLALPFTINETSDWDEKVYSTFNLCNSQCTRFSVFQIEPPLQILTIEPNDDAYNLEVCEGKIPTLLADLTGFTLHGNEVSLKNLNYDWWLGDPSDPNKVATLSNYHLQEKNGVKLDQALYRLRLYYPEATTLDGIIPRGYVDAQGHDDTGDVLPNLSSDMIAYLQELVDAGELVLHQKSINTPAKKVSEDDPYFYFVACPIHDGYFDSALHPTKPISAIKNGDMEGTDPSSFYMRVAEDDDNDPKWLAIITDGSGKDSRGIKIESRGKATPRDWDTQFFIRSNEVIPVGTKIHLMFDYKADAEATVATQVHAAPGNWLNNWRNLVFTNEWQTFDEEIEITNQMVNNNDRFQSIAFNLWTTREANTYYFDNVQLTYPAEDVMYYCDEPQGVRVKVVDKAPVLKCGFVPGENGFTEYHYPTDGDPVLSIRLARKAQFETVQHGYVNEQPVMPSEDNGPEADKENRLRYLWLPVRNAKVGTDGSQSVIRKTDDYNVYLASTDDPVWDKRIYQAMNKPVPSLPIFGKIVTLNAIDMEKWETDGDDENDLNRLCIYFVKKLFSAEDEGSIGTDDETNEDKYLQVREGYNYTLSLPFREDGENSCDGTLLINVKIVPDYEVWTGSADNTDWNNDQNWRRADGNPNPKWNENDELYVGAATDDSPLKGYKTNNWNYRTDKDRLFRKGFAPLYCTHVLIKSDEWGNAPVLYDAFDGREPNTTTGSRLTNAPFPNLRDKDGWDGTTGDNATKATATPILRYDMQARLYDIWPETYGEEVYPNKGREGDLVAEMYQINSCDEIAFQPGAELLNAHLLNYNSAWVEYQLDNKRWYLLGSPLQGTISGEWYAPKKTAQQKTTYYDPVTFGKYVPVTVTSDDNPAELGYYILSDKDYVLTSDASPSEGTVYYKETETIAYDRYNPAIYQRSWDKAKAVLYEVGAEYSTNDDNQTQNLGSGNEGLWEYNNEDPQQDSDWLWNVEGGGTADEYLDRLGYKPMGGKKANVAIKGIWSNTYNDAQVDYANGGFSVMVMNHLKGSNNDTSNDISIIRLPKEDSMYDYYEFSQTNANDGGTDTELGDVRGKGRALNRGRLKTDNLLPPGVTFGENDENTVSIARTETTVSRYGDQRTYTRIPIHEDALTAMDNTFLSSVGDGGTVIRPTAGFFTETVSAGVSNLGYYLVENPFTCGLNMDAFFAANPGLQKKYWLLTADGQHLVQYADGQWVSPDGSIFVTKNAVLAPGQGFFVERGATATWDFTNATVVADAVNLSETTESGVVNAIENNGIQLTIEANGKTISYDENNGLQVPSGVVVKVPVVSIKDVVTVKGSLTNSYTIGDTPITNTDENPTTSYMAKESDVTQGFVSIESTSDNNCFIYITVNQVPDPSAGDNTTIIFNREMQAQSRYGTKTGSRTFTIVVGQELEMQEVYIEVDLDGDGVLGEDYDNDGIVDEREAVMVPVYETNSTGDLIFDGEGNKIPKLKDVTEDVTIYSYMQTTETDRQYPLLARTRSNHHSSLPGLVIMALRGNEQSSALVMQREEASDDFMPSEDTETFIMGGDLVSPAVPTVYTLCGRLATTINSIREFRCLPVGVESNSSAPCTLTFEGVEHLGDSVAFYDAVERTLTPLKSGMKFKVSGQTQNRYYLVRTLNLEEAAEETHLQIFTEGLTAKVIASTQEPLTSVRCYDAAGRLVHAAQPQTSDYSFTLPSAGVYIIEAQTEHDRKSQKHICK